jgi:phage terminase large subunit-like protein
MVHDFELEINGSQPQERFWRSGARFRGFIGGVGSGKTKAGVVEVLRSEDYCNTVGAFIAPTFPMLRDALLRTFLATCEGLRMQGWPVLKDFHRSEMTAELITGTTILFRSADDPERLRGPNLGFFTWTKRRSCGGPFGIL